MKQENEVILTPIHYRIYDYLVERSSNNLFTKQAEIQQHLSSLGYNICTRTIRKFIHDIRSSDKFNKILLSNYNKGYRFMTTSEEFDYLLRRKKSILRMLKQYWKDVERYGKDGQLKLAFTPYEKEMINAITTKKKGD